MNTKDFLKKSRVYFISYTLVILLVIVIFSLIFTGQFKDKSKVALALLLENAVNYESYHLDVDTLLFLKDYDQVFTDYSDYLYRRPVLVDGVQVSSNVFERTYKDQVLLFEHYRFTETVMEEIILFLDEEVNIYSLVDQVSKFYGQPFRIGDGSENHLAIFNSYSDGVTYHARVYDINSDQDNDIQVAVWSDMGQVVTLSYSNDSRGKLILRIKKQ